jgi:hypothetical protein
MGPATSGTILMLLPRSRCGLRARLPSKRKKPPLGGVCPPCRLIGGNDVPITDFTSAAVEWFGAPTDVACLDRVRARPWAWAAHAAGFGGILYRLREDPKRRLGLALFGDAGENPPSFQPDGVSLPVGLQHELTDLFDGEYRGDPLLR